MSIIREIAKQKETVSEDEIIIKVGTVYSKIYGKISRKTINKIDKKLSYWFVGAQYSKPYKSGIWDGYIHLFSKKSKSFPTGFLNDVEKILNKRKIDFDIEDIREKLNISKESIIKTINFNKNIKPREYQIEALKKVLSEKVGIINIPTGTGKTLIINLIINAIDQETNGKAKHLIISSGLSLLNQLKTEINSFQKIKAGFIGQGKFEVARVTIASIDSLHSMFDKGHKHQQKLIGLLNNSTSLFLDEAHHSPSKTFKKVIQSCNAQFRIGTTATYKRSGGDDMMLKAVTGDIIYKKSISWMIKNGYLATPKIFLLEFRDKERSKKEIDKLYMEIKAKSGKEIDLKKVKKMRDWHKIYSVEIANNEKRNKLIAKAFKILYGFDLSIVLFVREKIHGEYFRNALDTEKFKNKIKLMSGNDDVKEIRIPTLNEFRSGSIRSIICTRILNEGIDFPEANCGIRTEGMMFDGNIIQQIGRILRKT